MKGAQFMDVFKQGNLVIPLYFLGQYKKFKITLEEFIFLMYLYQLGDKSLFNPSKYAKDLNIDSNKVMEYIGTLTDKKLIQVEVVKKEKDLMEEVVLLDGLYRKFSLLMVEDTNERNASHQSNIFELVEKKFVIPSEYKMNTQKRRVQFYESSLDDFILISIDAYNNLITADKSNSIIKFDLNSAVDIGKSFTDIIDDFVINTLHKSTDMIKAICIAFPGIVNPDKGVVEEVLSRVSENRVNVRFKMPDGSTYTKVINTSELRMPFPQMKSRFDV